MPKQLQTIPVGSGETFRSSHLQLVNNTERSIRYKIHVINLQRATGRLAAMQKKFDDLGLSFERIEATDGRALSPEQRQEFARARPRANGWIPGHIGCFCSHYQAWTEIAQGVEDFGVVFEDDVHISAALPKLLDAIGSHLEQFDVLRLEATKHRVLLNRARHFSVAGIDLVEVRSETWGAGAYVLPKRTAQLLLAEPVTNHSPVDFFLFDKGTSVVARRHRVYQAVPALCVQAKFDPSKAKPETTYASDIEHNSEDKALRHVIRRIGWRIRGFRNMLFGWRRIALSDDIVRL
jgi:glycosyl transferase family 25